MPLITNRADLYGELTEVARCFDCDEDTEINFTHVRNKGGNVFYAAVGDFRRSFSFPLFTGGDRLEYARYDVYTCKHALYRALSEYYHRELPWGSLTGIRPTRIAARLLERGVKSEDIAKRMNSDYLVSLPKAELTAEIIEVQRKTVGDRMSIINGGTEKCELVNLYAHVPFCPSRCTYCSFISQGIEKKKWLLSPYADALAEEIRRTKELAAEQNKRIFSVYVGGGTPTVLSAEQLYKTLGALRCDITEFTCEAGRPDTIDDEKMHVLYECGVNRVSINPQTLHDDTLVRIGRAHSVEQFFEAYNIAKKYGFVKNVDLIAGLEGETPEDFRASLDGVISLSPENITVHTLCVKRGSFDAQTEKKHNAFTEEMVDYSVAALKKAGYAPYYLYRQKQQSANLENIGWAKSGFLCVNNITVMEETLPVYACGAGAISKLMHPGGRITRFANAKDVIMYLRDFDERINKKELFLKQID